MDVQNTEYSKKTPNNNSDGYHCMSEVKNPTPCPTLAASEIAGGRRQFPMAARITEQLFKW